MNPKYFLPLLAAGLAVIVGLLFGPTQPSAQTIVRDVQVIESNAGPGYVPQDGLQDREECPCGPNCNCGADCPCRRSKAAGSQAIEIDPVTRVPVKGPSIIQLSTQGCGPCIMWWQNDRHLFTAKGWNVYGPVYGVSAPMYPAFRIWDGKQWFTHVGPLKGDNLRQMMAGGHQTQESQPRPVHRVIQNVIPQQSSGWLRR